MEPAKTYPSLTFALIVPIFLYIVHRIRQKGFPQGWWMPWMCVMFLVPYWIYSEWRTMRMDARTAAGLAILFGFLMSPWEARGKLRLVWADFWILGIIASQSASEFVSSTLATLVPLEQLRNYGLPYLIGRLCLQSPRDLSRLLPSVCLPLAILSVYALIESVTKINVINKALGQSWPLLEADEGFRWGLKRAQGNLSHPIYLGLAINLMMPWLMQARFEARCGQGPVWWKLMPALAVAAMVGTVSRAAQIATIITIMADFIFRNPRWRVPMLTSVLLVSAVGYIYSDEILEALSAYAGERNRSLENVIIKGREYPYSGTEHRRLLAIVYEDNVNACPPLGYGSNLDDMLHDNQVDERFNSIDDHYLLYYLSYGPVGLFFLIGFATCVCLHLIREAWRADNPYAGFCGCLLGAFLGTTLMVKGVAMEADFGWIWLFAAGVGAKMRSMHFANEDSLSPHPSPL